MSCCCTALTKLHDHNMSLKDEVWSEYLKLASVNLLPIYNHILMFCLKVEHTMLLRFQEV
jgi:hypothetical protein